jgi:hypothetical protein
LREEAGLQDRRGEQALAESWQEKIALYEDARAEQEKEKQDSEL